MRDLHVAGYNAEENKIILQDPVSEEEFSVVADDQLRAAARGDVPGLRQVKVEKSPSMRPSEIQELIRAGASTDELADKAGMQRSRLENLARPILMERANMVRRAQESHPILVDGPAEITLAMAIHTGLSARGVNYHDCSWDSWKTADGHWIIELRWEEGHADNTAHWRFQQDRSYAVTSPIDETASELTDPSFVPRRPAQVAPISSLGAARLRNSQTSHESRKSLALAAQRDAAGFPDSSRPGSVRRRTPGYVKSVTVSMDDLTNPTTPGPVRPPAEDAHAVSSSAALTPVNPPAEPPTMVKPARKTRTGGGNSTKSGKSSSRFSKNTDTEQLSLDEIRQFPSADDATAEDTDGMPPLAAVETKGPGGAFSRQPVQDSPAPAENGRSSGRKKKQKHPAMPSWEDVLLGVRGQQND